MSTPKPKIRVETKRKPKIGVIIHIYDNTFTFTVQKDEEKDSYREGNPDSILCNGKDWNNIIRNKRDAWWELPYAQRKDEQIPTRDFLINEYIFGKHANMVGNARLLINEIMLHLLGCTENMQAVNSEIRIFFGPSFQVYTDPKIMYTLPTTDFVGEEYETLYKNLVRDASLMTYESISAHMAQYQELQQDYIKSLSPLPLPEYKEKTNQKQHETIDLDKILLLMSEKEGKIIIRTNKGGNGEVGKPEEAISSHSRIEDVVSFVNDFVNEELESETKEYPWSLSDETISDRTYKITSEVRGEFWEAITEMSIYFPRADSARKEPQRTIRKLYQNRDKINTKRYN
eukprot:Pompholyxophrys_sp_v1_NODE_5_length_12280_cov_3.373988.p4 type:complete len:344 gc:universal NODE_5_length_12280_cov_3.373988:3050-4081(+)